MVKKLVLQVTDPLQHPTSAGQRDPRDPKPLLLLNTSLLDIVTTYKNKITEYYKNKLWDKFKKLSNEYEHVFYSPNASNNIALYNPVSRSFFKLWEILHDFEDVIRCNTNASMKCAFIAEGPGGFFEAFQKKRREYGLDEIDTYHGITLKSNHKNIPDWKMAQLPLRISYGEDGTGNLYNIENIRYFTKEVGRNTVDFITADGGFDFSSDFNNQEEQSFRLILCEVLLALLLQKDGGNFLLKVYDCFNPETLALIHVLKKCYKTLYFIKPLTSRPANSERYILCTQFCAPKSRTDTLESYINKLSYLVSHYDILPLSHIYEKMAIPLDYDTVHYIVMYNMYYTVRQVFYIQRTINYIQFFKKQNEDVVMKVLLEKHGNKSRKWCKKYNIPYKA